MIVSQSVNVIRSIIADCPLRRADSDHRCNLDIHNMEFESFVAEEDIYERADRNTRIWWTYQSVSNEPDLCAEDQQRRDDEIERLQADGRI